MKMGGEKGDEFEMEKLRKQNQINNNFENGHSRKNKIIAGISVIVIILTLVIGYVLISVRDRQLQLQLQNQSRDPTTKPDTNNRRKPILHAISIGIPDSRKYLRDVIKTPKATFENPEEFYFNQASDLNPNCSVLPLRLRQGPRILNTFFTCVRLYSLENCVGKSTAYYPKFRQFDDQNSEGIQIHEKFRSIGPCFVNELDQSVFHINKNNGQKEFQKSKIPGTSSSFKFQENKNELAVPDIVEISPDLTSVNQENDPTSFFHTDENQRLTLARVIISGQDLESNNTNVEEIPPSESLNETIAEKKSNDTIGYFVHPKFSPELKVQDNNAFFQSPWNRKILQEVEKSIENYVKENPDEKVEIVIQVEYEKYGSSKNNIKISNRPTGFFYRIRYPKMGQIQTYYFKNP